jgi:hypothetical protein
MEDFYMNDFVETRIIEAVRGLLTGRVNEILNEAQFVIPVIEFNDYDSGNVVVPVITLAGCERTEKERIVRIDTYSLTITFSFPEMPEGELFCYAFSGAVGRVFYDDPTLGGVVDRAIITGKKYVLPKKPGCGESYALIVSVRIKVEGLNV